METFSQCDLNKILITGSSGGGTASYYSACYDERIKVSVPNCSFCSYKTSIMNIYHCSCNFIPHAYEWFEMQDLACLIAPRSLLAVNAKEDLIFLLLVCEMLLKQSRGFIKQAVARKIVL